MIPLFMNRDPFFEHFSAFNPHSLWNEYCDFNDDDFDWFYRNIDNEDFSDDEEREEEEEEKEEEKEKERNYPYFLHSVIPTHHDHKHKGFTSVIRPHFLLHRCRSVPYYPLRRKLYRALLHHNKEMEEKKNNEQKMNSQTKKEQVPKEEKENNLKQGQNQEQNKEKEQLKQKELHEKSQEKCEKKNENENENSNKKQVSIQRPKQDLEKKIFHDFFDFNFDAFSPKINFGEDEKHYYLHADLPGMTKDQVKMEISEDGILTLSGKREYVFKNGNENENEKIEKKNKDESKNEDKMEVETETETETETGSEMKIDQEEEKNKENKKKEEKYSMMECSYGQFERSLTLPEDIDLEHISAKMENGALEVTFNKIIPDKKEHIHSIQIQ